MKLITLIENQKKLEKAEVEIQMLPGIPQIHFLGLPDQAIKESFLRIKSALKVCGFSFPSTNQMIVNIKPNHLKKSSKGLELAVALGILHITNQKIIPDPVLRSIIYGELCLNGEVNEPLDLIEYKKNNMNESVLTGHDTYKYNNADYRISKLNEDIQFIQNLKNITQAQRPSHGLEYQYTNDEAELLFLISTSNLHVLLSGPAGSGKTTLAKNSISFLKNKKLPTWPIVLAPHSSVTAAAFLGGGTQLYQGEIEKVQNGILFLDEFLEFDKDIIETLRSPMTGEKLRLSRAGLTREFNCDFQVIATTNLCPCGKWTPEIKIRTCRFSNRKCQAYLEKLSGPILDRYGIYYYSNQKTQKRTISGFEILNRIEKFEQIQNSNSLGLDKLNTIKSEILLESLYPDISMRRKNSLLKVATIYAIERESSTIESKDLTKAEKWTYTSFLGLERGMS